MRLRSSILAVLASFAALSVSAQWATQTISLRPGWNAVYLEVQPEPRSCDVIFSNVPVESIWGWNRKFAPVQFIQDTDELISPQSDWLNYLPPANPASSQKTLFSLEGGKTYLIKTPTNGVTRTLTLTGTPTLRKIKWLANSFNFVGFSINTAAPPTFQAFFQASSAHVNSQIYRLSAAGHWLPVSASSTSMQSNEAFWIYTTGNSDYAGPFQITMEQSTGLDYGNTLTEQTVRIKNLTTTAKTLIVRQLGSLPPPTSGFPALAGTVALSYWKMNLASNQFWVPFPSQLTSPSIAANTDWALRLEVRRPDMPPYAGATGPAGALYESILEITDTAGSFRYRIPITSQGLQTKGAQFAVQGIAPTVLSKAIKASVSPLAGLWLGAATVANVSQPSNASDPTTPSTAASEFQLRLIFHVDSSGHARLLQRVFQLWQPGTTTNNPDGIAVAAEPGRFVLVSDEKYLSHFSGSTIVDGSAVGRRFSSAAFGFDNSISNIINNTFGSTNLWSCRVTCGYDAPTNPFKHKYHPDHDNLVEGYQNLPPDKQKLSEGVESFTVTRDIQLKFTAADPDGLSVAGWGDNQIGGNYSETISGLHRQAINVSGTFRLRRASTVAVLNDGLTSP